MTTLESVYLKNVVLYLIRYSDIINIIQVNKKCYQTITTMYINPYKSTQFCSTKQIMNIFTSLQTLYISNNEMLVNRKQNKTL